MFHRPLVQHSAEKQEAKDGNRQPELSCRFEDERKNEQSHRKAKRNKGRGCHNGHSFPHKPYISIISRGANVKSYRHERG
jgi:hypothetical protein